MEQAADVRDVQNPVTAPAAEPGRWRRLLGLAPLLAAVLATAWVFRGVRRGSLPGDIGDARWTLGVHEHWYGVWRGQEAIRDLHYYFPLPNTLGSSDAFLVQGQIYSLLRLVGFDQINSWLIASMAFFLVGALGVGVLASQLLFSRLSQVALVLLSVASYPVLIGLVHVQLVGLLSVSWIFVGLHDLVSRDHIRRGVTLLVVVPPLLALSSWYAMALGAILVVVLGLALLLISSRQGIVRMVRQVAGDLWRTLRSIPGVILAVLLVVLWIAVLWVYLPSRGLLPKSGWPDVLSYSPRWSDVWNSSDDGGGLWSSLFARLPEYGQSNGEQQFGFTPVVFLAFAVVTLAVFRSVVLAGRSARPPAADARTGSGVGRSGLLAASLSVIGVIVLFLIDERGLSFYRIVWALVPGMEAVRAPFRVMIIVYGVVFFVILRAVELLWLRHDWLHRVSWRRAAFAVGGLLLVGLMFVEMQRPFHSTWTRADLLSPALLAQIGPAQQECDAVILLNEEPDAPGWKNPIDAVVFATLSGLPTPQGYSRADPLDYPGQIGSTDGSELARWMRAKGFDGRICAVTSTQIRVLPF